MQLFVERVKECNICFVVVYTTMKTLETGTLKYNEVGTDNLYMGSYKNIKALIEKFHFELDDILNMNKEIYNQEYLVNIIAEMKELLVKLQKDNLI